MDALTIIEKDHRKLTKLFNSLNSTTLRADKKRKKLFADVIKEYNHHTELEDIFFSALNENLKSYYKITEAYEENNYISQIIADIKELDYRDTRWLAKINVLKGNIDYHFKEVEAKMFPVAKKVFKRKELNLIGQRMMDIQANYNNGFLKNVFHSMLNDYKKIIKNRKTKKLHTKRKES